MKLSQIAKTIRSKNAGVDKITFDVIFPDHDSFEMVRRSRALTRETVALLYRIANSRISRLRRVRSRQRHQVHHLSRAPQRQPWRRGHLRRSAICPAA